MRIVFVYILVIAIYLELPLPLNENFYIPGFITIFSVPFMLLYFRNSIKKIDLRLVTSLFIIFIISAFFSIGAEYLNTKLFKGVVQSTASILSGLLLYRYLEEGGAKQFETVLTSILILIFFGTFFEVIGVLKGPSDAFKEFAYGRYDLGYQNYTNFERDFTLAGFIRPSLFVSEPSLVSIGFSAFLICWFMVASYDKFIKLTTAFVGIFGMMLFTVSPILIITLFMVVVISVFQEIQILTIFKLFAVFVLFLVSLVGFITVLEIDLFSRLSQRTFDAIYYMGTLGVTSENVRLVFPFLTMIDVIKISPLFGVGISGKDIVIDITSLPYIDLPFLLGSNNFALMIIYLGVLGSTLFCISFYKYLKHKFNSKSIWLIGILVFCLMFMMGGFETPRFWGIVFCLIYSVQIFQSRYFLKK